MAIAQFIEAHGVGQEALAQVLGVTPSAVSRKLNGLRRWTREDIDQVLAFLSRHLGRPVTYEETFRGDDNDLEPTSQEAVA